MPRFHFIASLTVLLLTLVSTKVSALSYAYVPENVRLMTAEFVVVGTMGDVQQVNRDITGTLTITEVLKGKPEGKTMKLAWADLSQFGGGRGHQNGQTGIWILSRNHKGDYAADYPGNVQPTTEIKRIKQALKDIDNLKWTEADGLAFTYVTEMHDLRNARVRVPAGEPNPTARLSIYPVVRNVSKKSLRVCEFHPDKPFAVSMKTPTGSKVEADLYPNANNQKLNARFFHELEPSQTRMLSYGLNVPNLTELGTYHITVSFQNKRDGKEFDLENVWTGELKAPAREVKTPG